MALGAWGSFSVKRLQCISADEAEVSFTQHKKPCSDCPWARRSLKGWLGGLSAEEWLREAHGEARIDCHTKIGPHCAGAAIYRANMAKKPRNKEALVLPADRETVFATPMEFREHHERED